MTTSATYRGTGGTFLRAGAWAVLLAVAPDHGLVGRCWDRIARTSDPEDVLDTLVVPGRRDLPAFALVHGTGARRVVAHGEIALALDGRDVAGEQHTGTWLDLPLADVTRVEIALPGDPAVGPGLPLGDGIAAARSVHLVLDDATPTAPGEQLDHLHADTRPFAEAGEAGEAAATTAPRYASAGPTSPDATRPATFTSGLAATPGRPGRAGRTGLGGRRPPTPGDTGADGPRVLAAVCPAGHLTPAYAGLCRVCGQPVGAREAFETARPALGRLVLPEGDAVLLDRGAVLGRAPHVPGGWSGAPPHLVTVRDEAHDVSAQHVSVVLDLWNVLVCDLGSTNGTSLVAPGGRVIALRPYEPVALGPGSAIVLADVVTVQFEIHP